MPIQEGVEDFRGLVREDRQVRLEAVGQGVRGRAQLPVSDLGPRERAPSARNEIARLNNLFI